ncbi:TPA: DUF2635 domain-containing protein, partial [Escherichia coli]
MKPAAKPDRRNSMFVKPVPGRRVRYPGDPSRLLPDEGAEVPDRDLFWRRRLKQ